MIRKLLVATGATCALAGAAAVPAQATSLGAAEGITAIYAGDQCGAGYVYTCSKVNTPPGCNFTGNTTVHDDAEYKCWNRYTQWNLYELRHECWIAYVNIGPDNNRTYAAHGKIRNGWC